MTGQAISKANFMIYVFVFRFERESWLSWKVVASGTGMKSWQGCFDIFSPSSNFFLQIYLSKLQISFGCQDKYLTKGVACLLYSVWLPVSNQVWSLKCIVPVSFLYLKMSPGANRYTGVTFYQVWAYPAKVESFLHREIVFEGASNLNVSCQHSSWTHLPTHRAQFELESG